MTKRKTTKKKIDKEKESSDWFDTHVEVMGFGRGTRNKKVKSIIKEQVMKSLSKEIYEWLRKENSMNLSIEMR